MLPSCVPSIKYDESLTNLTSEHLKLFYSLPRVLDLSEVMSYSKILNKDKELLKKVNDAKEANKIVNGPAPLLTGKNFGEYISAGIQSDHECSSFEEAKERIQKGQYIMIREGTSARNLEGLINLLDAPYSDRCMLVAYDKHAKDLMANGHIDYIIRKWIKFGKSLQKSNIF